MSGTPPPKHNGCGGRGAPVLIPVVPSLVVGALACACPQLMHAYSGVEKGMAQGGKPVEIMGMMLGRPDTETPNALIVTDVSMFFFFLLFCDDFDPFRAPRYIPYQYSLPLCT